LISVARRNDLINLKSTENDQSFALLFQLKKTKMLSDGNAPIYLSITIDRDRVEIATKRHIIPINGTQ